MNKWLTFFLAIISEVIATASIKSTEEFTNLIPSVVVIIGYCAAFYFLSLTLDEIPLRNCYALGQPLVSSELH